MFAIQPYGAVINDLNEQLCLTYEVIRDDVEPHIELSNIHKNNNSSDYYYAERESVTAPNWHE